MLHSLALVSNIQLIYMVFNVSISDKLLVQGSMFRCFEVLLFLRRQCRLSVVRYDLYTPAKWSVKGDIFAIFGRFIPYRNNTLMDLVSETLSRVTQTLENYNRLIVWIGLAVEQTWYSNTKQGHWFTRQRLKKLYTQYNIPLHSVTVIPPRTARPFYFWLCISHCLHNTTTLLWWKTFTQNMSNTIHVWQFTTILLLVWFQIA